jgi:hypothetical protein
VLETDEEKPLTADEKLDGLNGRDPEYHPSVAACRSMSLNASAHFSTHRNATAYGRYAVKMLARSANACVWRSPVSMYFRNPSDRRISRRPRAVRRGIARAVSVSSSPPAAIGRPSRP